MERRLLDQAREAVFWTNWRVQLTIPSVLAPGEEFALRMTAFGPDRLPSSDFGREIVFEPSPGIEGLPASVRFAAAAGGHLLVDGLRTVDGDRAFVQARPEGCPGSIVSNPAWIVADPPTRVFWGDLHIHTTYSNCSAWACKDPEFAYAYARDATHLDFAAAADHLRGIASEPGRWPRLQQLVRRYDAPGRFVPLLAFESSHRAGFGGDNNAYYLDADGPFFWPDRDDMLGTSPEVELQALWDFLDSTGEESFTVPHHTGRAGKYRSFAAPVYDPDREPVFEVYSCWGSSESRWNRFPLHAGNTDEPAYLVDALRAGCRYGVTASSDDHCTLPGGEPQGRLPAGPARVSLYTHRGLAAVCAPELTRETLWSALRSRRCYATTFARTLLDVRIGDASMGDELPVGPKDKLRCCRQIRVRVLSATQAPPDIVLMRNGTEIARRRWRAEEPETVFDDVSALEDIAVRGAAFHPGPFVVYYVRLETAFDHTQWSSPIWLDL